LNHEVAQTLNQGTSPRDSRLKSAFLKALETIKSDYERGRVLSVLLKNKQIS
jgi:hypothetical protein